MPDPMKSTAPPASLADQAAQILDRERPRWRYAAELARALSMILGARCEPWGDEPREPAEEAAALLIAKGRDDEAADLLARVAPAHPTLYALAAREVATLAPAAIGEHRVAACRAMLAAVGWLQPQWRTATSALAFRMRFDAEMAKAGVQL